jgi:hemoglobin/transferrin/lactoferrin receptor protein
MTGSIKYVALFILLVSLIDSSYGQDREKKLFSLGPDDLSENAVSGKEEIISASRSLKEKDDIPFTVHIISRKEILKHGYITLADALKSVPGIRISQPGSGIEGETFMLRGLNGNYYCKVLIDGIPVQPTVVSGMPVSAQLPVRQARRIEITFGPSSSVYGADALAGVINIVMHESDRPVTAQADIALGTNGQEYLNVTIGGKAGKNKNVLTYSLFGSAMNRSDMNIKSDISGVYSPALYDSSYSFLSAPFYKGDSTRPELGRLPETSQLLGFSLKWRGLSFQFLNMSRRTHSSIGQVTDFYSYSNPSNFWGETIRRYNLAYQYSKNKFSSATTLSMLSYRLNPQSSFGLIYPVGNTGNAYKYAASDDFLIDQLVTYIPLPGLELTGGINLTFSGNLPKTNDLYEPFAAEKYSWFSKEGISDTSFGAFGYNPVTFYNLGGFLQAYFKKGKFVLLAGYRYDYHSRYKGASSPRVAAQFIANENLFLRGSVGWGFRAPSAYYTYSSLAWQLDTGIYYSGIPNTALKPERIFSTALGMRWDLKEKITMDLSLFYNRLFNQFTRSLVLLDPEIYPDASNPNRISQAYVNDDDSRAELIGLQLAFVVKDLVERVHLNLDMNLSLSKGKEILPNGFGEIDSYRQWPVALGQLNVSLKPVNFLYLYFRNIISSGWTRQYFPLNKDILDAIGYDTKTKGYYTLDLVARLIINRNFQAFFQMNNLFNANYAGIDAYGSETDLRYNPQYGRNIRIGLSFTLE